MHTVAVMPVYNGAETVRDVVDRVPWDTVDELYMVDDGSTDDSWDVLTTLESEYDEIRAFQHDENKGYGGGQKTLYDEVLDRGGDIAVMIHQDEHYAPEEIPEVVEPIENEDDTEIVFAPRYGMLSGGYPLHRYLGNRILTTFQNVTLGTDLYEFHTGFRAYSAAALEEIDYHNCTDQFHFDTDVVGEIQRAGLYDNLKEVPTDCYYDDNASANPWIFSYTLNCAKSVVNYRFGPDSPQSSQAPVSTSDD
ncbi:MULTISPECIES: glycosyltransferase family 2 protein [Haloarcula]|nr:MULTISPECIES: glycosyltransferase family 2 protein [Halomicroarcula]MBX0348737.1 glycosyltransferase family 2 protein [Halomicroarcula pellucida]MDS0278505.1 glycosyltransferase family 2 protein [Halomicroarcula sp. S1AR25-4]